MSSVLRIAAVVVAVIGVENAWTAPAPQSASVPQARVTELSPVEATARIVASAQALVATLDDAGRAKVQFPFDGPQKTRWSNFPSGIFERQGLKLGDLSTTQRAAAMTLLQTALSPRGYQKVVEIMEGDEFLNQNPAAGAPQGGPGGQGARRGGPSQGTGGARGDGPPPANGRGRGGPGGGLIFGRDLYYLAFVGTPSATEPWMLQFGGHHLAINLTLGGSRASMTPSLPAVQPATFTVEGRTIRPLGAENDKAFALINALDNTQRSQAVLNYRVADLVLGPGQDGRTIQPEGIRASALTSGQQTQLLDIMREWAGIMNDAYAEPRMAELKASLPLTYFAWSGPLTNGSAAYFRIQGPTIVIEYAPQQGDVQHIHTIYRDPTNDYGAAFARR